MDHAAILRAVAEETRVRPVGAKARTARKLGVSKQLVSKVTVNADTPDALRYVPCPGERELRARQARDAAEQREALLRQLIVQNVPEIVHAPVVDVLPVHEKRWTVAPQPAVPYAPGIVHNQAHLDAALRLALASLQVTWWTGCVVMVKAPALGTVLLLCCVVFAVILWKERTWRRGE